MLKRNFKFIRIIRRTRGVIKDILTVMFIIMLIYHIASRFFPLKPIVKKLYISHIISETEITLKEGIDIPEKLLYQEGFISKSFLAIKDSKDIILIVRVDSSHPEKFQELLEDKNYKFKPSEIIIGDLVDYSRLIYDSKRVLVVYY